MSKTYVLSSYKTLSGDRNAIFVSTDREKLDWICKQYEVFARDYIFEFPLGPNMDMYFVRNDARKAFVYKHIAIPFGSKLTIEEVISL
jgi:hypothetical protein